MATPPVDDSLEADEVRRAAAVSWEELRAQLLFPGDEAQTIYGFDTATVFEQFSVLAQRQLVLTDRTAQTTYGFDTATVFEQLSVLARMQLALSATATPLAVTGTCAIDGTEMRYVGREEGLFMCCSNYEQHCWPVGGRAT
jgi:hypothetical protein